MTEQNVTNLRYYAYSAEPPADATRGFTNAKGFSGTDINSMWRIRVLTEMFGPAGLGWYTEESYTVDGRFGEHQEVIFCDLNLFVRDPETGEWSMPITGQGGNQMWGWKWKNANTKDEKVWLPNDDAYKMAWTDAFGSACKKLGIGAKIYWSADRSKYTVDEDGNPSVYTPSDAEVKAANRARMAEEARADPFLGKKADPVKTAIGPDSEFMDGETIAAAAKARRESINVGNARAALAQLRRVEPDNEILTGYIEKYGGLSKLRDEQVVSCYLDLQDAGVIQ